MYTKDANLQNFPKDVQQNIMSFLDITNRLAFAKTSKSLAKADREATFWVEECREKNIHIADCDIQIMVKSAKKECKAHTILVNPQKKFYVVSNFVKVDKKENYDPTPSPDTVNANQILDSFSDPKVKKLLIFESLNEARRYKAFREDMECMGPSYYGELALFQITLNFAGLVKIENKIHINDSIFFSGVFCTVDKKLANIKSAEFYGKTTDFATPNNELRVMSGSGLTK